MPDVNSPSRSVFVVVCLLIMVGVACDLDRSSVPDTPTAPSTMSPTPVPPPVTVTPLPPLIGASTTYRFSEPLENWGSRRVSGYTERSAFVLYESGGFYAEYDGYRYLGRYERDAGRIAFYFDERSTSAGAIGTIEGTRLEIRYSDMMQHSDFENAAYELSRSDSSLHMLLR